MAPSALKDRHTVVTDLVRRLNVRQSIVYHYLNGDGSLKEPGTKLMGE